MRIGREHKPVLVLLRVNDRLGAHPFLKETNVSGIYPPLGVAYLAATARRAGYRASIIDAQALNHSHAQLTRAVAQAGADVVAITATTFNWPVVAQTARRLRASSPGLKIWVGGPQLSLYPDECMEEQAIDVAVVGEGEQPLLELLACAASGDDPAGIPGTITRQGDGGLIKGPPTEPVQDLDTLPLPAVGLLPLARYHALTLPPRFISMVTSRGCPFRCRYCSQVYVGGKYREHSAARVLEELTRAVNVFHAAEIVFFDETFSLNRRRVLEICDGILARDLKMRWNIRTRADRLDDEVLRAIRDAGCWSIHVGIESGSARVQRLMNKNLKLDRVAQVLESARRLGLETRGYFMLGYPGETPAEMEQTIRLALELPLDWASFTITQPMAGTDIYVDALQAGAYGSDYWRDYTLQRVSEPLGYFISAGGLDQQQLEGLLNSAYRRFYLRPSMILSKLKTARIWREVPSIIRTLMEIRLSRAGRLE